VTTLSTDQGLTLPEADDGDNVPQSFDDYNDGVESRLVKRYTSSADRTTRNPTPTEGELSYLTSTDTYETYTGSAWAELLASRPRGIVAAPTISSSDGTATGANTTEVRDAVLGNYQVTLSTGRRYRVTYTGAQANTATADVRYVTRIRNSESATTPTTSSTLIAEDTKHMGEASTGGRQTIHVTHTFTVSTSGTHTFSVFTISPESAVLTPIAAAVSRELYIEDIGAS
jgi:hypothetical protein